MKKVINFAIIFIATAMLIGITGASQANVGACNPSISLLNQDPYPAIPGEYVKLVFQVDGLDNSNCGNFYFELINDYPISFDPGANTSLILQSGTYVSNYGSFALVPFKVRVNETALNGDNELWVKYSPNNQVAQPTYFLKKLNLAVNDTKSDFEVSIKDYDYTTQTATFEILNIGKNNVEGLTVDLPNQENFSVKGNTRNILGSFNSGDDTSFTFEGIPKKGAISLDIKYNDNIGVRRELTKAVNFDPELFTGRIKDQKSTNYTFIIVLLIVIGIIVWLVIRSRNKKKKNALRLQALKRN